MIKWFHPSDIGMGQQTKIGDPIHATNRLKDENHVIILLKAEKGFNKIQ